MNMIFRGRAIANDVSSNKQTCPDKEENKWEFTTGNGFADAGDLRLRCVSQGTKQPPAMVKFEIGEPSLSRPDMIKTDFNLIITYIYGLCSLLCWVGVVVVHMGWVGLTWILTVPLFSQLCPGRWYVLWQRGLVDQA